MSSVLFKNGYVINGSGEKGFIGDVLVENNHIKCVSKTSLNGSFQIIDCTGLAISPGFIDSHSHHDNCIFYNNDLELTEPFIRQGITTYVAGQCGYSAAGVEVGSPYGNETSFMTPTGGEDKTYWNTYAEYFGYLRKNGIRQNMAMMAGHGIALGSVVGSAPSGRSSPENMKRVAAILEEGMDAGCKGISFGLGYPPGVFVPDTEVREVSELAIKRNKLVTIHSRVAGSVAADIYGNDFSIPHNIRWMKEFLELYRNSGCRLQISHLLFVGRKAWPSYDQMFEMLQNYMDNGGMDLWFDMYSYVQGITSVALRMPKFFYDHIPKVYTDSTLIVQLKKEMEKIHSDRGIEAGDVLLCDPVVPDMMEYRGMTMDEICKRLNMSLAEVYMDLYRRSNGAASIYLLIEQPEENVPKQMMHERALYMTDAWIVPGSLQNPCAYGSLPKFLRIARETGNMPIEQVITRMTGRAAKRFDLENRGLLKEGYFADIVVFNPETIAEKATSEQPEQNAIGITHVYINGQHVLNEDKIDTSVKAGMVL